MFVKRFAENPILKPNPNQSWEAEAVFNGCPIEKGGKIFLLYRAVSLPHYHTSAQSRLRVSDIGVAESKNGFSFSNRRRLVIPEHEWEKFGCEDPRVTKLNGKYYVFYTALSDWPPRAEGIKVGLAISKDLETIAEKHLITPFNAKAMAMFPEKINGKIWTILTADTDRPPAKIALASFDDEAQMYDPAHWQNWYKNIDKHVLPLLRRPQDHMEVGAPPLKTKNGWLVIYSYIRNYFSAQKIFGIEAVLLDLKNPLKIVGRTNFPIILPEEYYEKYGFSPNIVFPSGALIKNGVVYIYYGSADTTCSVASVPLSQLLEEMANQKTVSGAFSRPKENPILSPLKNSSWETTATFNPAAIYLENKVHLVYRAMSADNTSVMGYAQSPDGIRISYRSPDPIYTPREPFEQKTQPGGNSGTEDPRLVKIGSKIYMFYTAFDGKNPPRVALTWIKDADFLKRKWNWATPVLISPPGIDDKDACMFPEKIKGKYAIIHRSGDDIDLSFHKNLDFEKDGWLEEYRWVMPRRGFWDSRKVGAAAPPLKTKEGWVLIYHGVSEEDGIYRVGALLVDLHDPTTILGRTDYPLFEPQAVYEKQGIVPNVVFPCGAVLVDKKVFMYYGGADKVAGVATISMKDIINSIKH
ncbi:MAG: hypothetical protein M1153_00450 [Patescibacteria group bacterium]|nr:hypothetical protein [Patescibacteria group bacterium]